MKLLEMVREVQTEFCKRCERHTGKKDVDECFRCEWHQKFNAIYELLE